MLGIALFLSLDAQCTPCNVTFYTSNHGSQIHENPDHCSLKLYPLTTFPNWTDNENKSRFFSWPPRSWCQTEVDPAQIVSSGHISKTTCLIDAPVCFEDLGQKTTLDSAWIDSHNYLKLLRLFTVHYFDGHPPLLKKCPVQSHSV